MSEEVIVLLEAIESELRRQDIWLPMPPSVEAMASTTPFCMDTMAFSQWLQWIFVPRIRAIIDSGGSLPKGSNIKPYAEESLPLERLEVERLLLIIEQFDRLMS
ncbi:YqcC family protein [Endozoicomonas sp. SESOKO1]|uniref:YqcC family protein n=1 Tax=Endozoicomonas sp. SESOKO1 TaxID=2828742 RepID=UPI00214747BE|nr:YqcC family protein [Endozoicomonas sp. SESOKO1]